MKLNSCRLCKGIKYLSNLYEIDGDVRLDTKASFCLDVKVKVVVESQGSVYLLQNCHNLIKLHPKDSYPVMICRRCKRNVQKFYKFKQMCLKVELELRSASKNLSNTNLKTNHEPSNLEYNFEEFPSEPMDFFEDNFLYLQHSETTLRKDDDFAEDNEVIIPVIDNIELSKNYLPTQHQNDNSLQCDLCGSIFETKREFKIHKRSHIKTKTFQCGHCPKSFTRAENRAIHMQKHLGIKPYVCEICGQSATKKQDLRRHMKIHSDEKEHECDTCGRRFKRSGDLCSHIRTHTGARPYGCKLCDKTYTSHSGLRKHFKTHT